MRMLAPYQLSVVPAVFEDFDRLMNTFSDFNGLEADRDVHETDEAFVASFDMPGVKRENIGIEVKGQHLTIRSVRQRPKRAIEKFEQSFALPSTVDESKIEVNYEDGVLSLLLPKVQEEKPRTVEVKSGAGFFTKLASKTN